MYNKHIIKQFCLHLASWLSFYAFLYSLRRRDNLDQKMLYSFLTISFFSAVASYIHFLLFQKLFEQRKYKKYSLYLIISIVSVSVFNQLITNIFDKLTFISSFISLVFVHIFASAFYFAKNGITKQIQVQELRAKQLEAEMKALKAQIHPHFLFNTLNNLYGLIVQNQNEQAADITLKLSDLMRYLLESSKSEKVNLQKEVKFLEDYLALEKIRLAQQADIRLEVSGIEKEVFIAPLLFIPLVENAFKHGLQSISARSFAHFSLALQGNELYFEAHNSVGKMLAYPPKSGTGLDNLRKRLELMYPKKYFLEIEENENSFKVTLHLNL